MVWAVPTVLVLLSIWKLVGRDWNLGDAVALMVLSVVIMLYYTQDISKIISEVAKVGLGIGTGIVVGYLIKGDD